MMTCCIIGLRTSLLLLIIPCICPIFFPSTLWRMKFFVKDFSTTMQARRSYLVCRLMMTCCIVGLRTSLLLLIFPCIFPIFFPSILWRMRFFVTDFSTTLQAGIIWYTGWWGLVVQWDWKPALFCLFFSAFDFLSLLTLNKAFFVTYSTATLQDIMFISGLLILPSMFVHCSFSSLRRSGRVAQSVGHLTRKSGVLGSIPGLASYFRFSFRFFKKGSCQLLTKVCARSTG